MYKSVYASRLKTSVILHIKNGLLKQYNKNTKAFLITIENDFFITNARIKFGTWFLKDIVSHLVAWDNEVLRQFKLFNGGFTDIIELDIELFNEKAVRGREHLSINDNIRELKKTKIEINTIINTLTEHQFNKNKQYKEWLEVEAAHYKHHTLKLRNAILSK